MGEGYLAEDTRLVRNVDLKILREHLFDRAELRERFEREARAVSSLNHPHICTLHDLLVFYRAENVFPLVDRHLVWLVGKGHFEGGLGLHDVNPPEPYHTVV